MSNVGGTHNEITLSLSTEEAALIQTILGRVGGDPSKTERGDLNEIILELMDRGLFFNLGVHDRTVGYLYVISEYGMDEEDEKALADLEATTRRHTDRLRGL